MRVQSSRRVFLLALALAMGATACASGGGGGDGDEARPEGATSSRIVRAELEALGPINGQLAVSRLRPRWLQPRGGPNGDPPVLYVNGARRGNVNQLASFLATEIERIEFMSAADATTRYGTGHRGGAILVYQIR
jgi:hypothetical protein